CSSRPVLAVGLLVVVLFRRGRLALIQPAPVVRSGSWAALVVLALRRATLFLVVAPVVLSSWNRERAAGPASTDAMEHLATCFSRPASEGLVSAFQVLQSRWMLHPAEGR